ncbi:LytR/AlgR family response regulator transcription factor [Flavobacterium crassostreae]|uniref:DNA-binding response regulator n=1 Tax=Flavobacterium crassostreae TaxID=1763534 RepID=A0A1B9E967_9FLAO|nr:LytTR family DNA-binding domain-containing protein [Flavobacterium crassostreae]OCB78472.1 DNA-binding response regulator [Flavobacterium crassostreae]
MNCIIIDDEEMARAILTQFIVSHTNIEVVATFSNAMDAIKFLNQNQVDLIFLDIHMPNFTGFDLIQTIKNPPHTILVTSDSNFAIEAFEYDCIVDYLLKPITAPRFLKAIDKVNALALNESTTATTASVVPTDFYINVDRRLIKIELNSIDLIEAKGDYIHIKTESKNYMVHSTLKNIAHKLPKEIFLKVHRSFIINVKKIIDIEDNSVLIGKNVVPVSRSNKTELLNRINVL